MATQPLDVLRIIQVDVGIAEVQFNPVAQLRIFQVRLEYRCSHLLKRNAIDLYHADTRLLHSGTRCRLAAIPERAHIGH